MTNVWGHRPEREFPHAHARHKLVVSMTAAEAATNEFPLLVLQQQQQPRRSGRSLGSSMKASWLVSRMPGSGGRKREKET